MPSDSDEPNPRGVSMMHYWGQHDQNIQCIDRIRLSQPNKENQSTNLNGNVA